MIYTSRTNLFLEWYCYRTSLMLRPFHACFRACGSVHEQMAIIFITTVTLLQQKNKLSKKINRNFSRWQWGSSATEATIGTTCTTEPLMCWKKHKVNEQTALIKSIQRRMKTISSYLFIFVHWLLYDTARQWLQSKSKTHLMWSHFLYRHTVVYVTLRV